MDFRGVPAVNPELSERIRQLIQEHPTFGYRRIWAILRNREGLVVNHKAVYRILKVKKWLVHHRTKTPKPRVQGSRSISEKSNERWAIDITHISPAGKTVGGTWWHWWTAMTGAASGMNLPSGAGRRKRRELWRKPV